MIYFLDNDISYRFAGMLRALDVEIKALRELMPGNTKDPDFLGILRSQFGIDVLISANSAQRTNLVEAKLLKQSGVTSLYFNPFFAKLEFWDQARWLVKYWVKIDGFCQGAAQGTCADLQQNGRARIYRL